MKKQRQTEQGNKCLKWWRLDWKLIAGCTTKPDPDGGNSGKEWCRMEREAGSNKDWGWCESELDYDGLRQYVNDYYETEIIAFNKMSFAMQKLQPVCAQIMNKFKDIKEQQDTMFKTIAGKLNSSFFINRRQNTVHLYVLIIRPSEGFESGMGTSRLVNCCCSRQNQKHQSTRLK